MQKVVGSSPIIRSLSRSWRVPARGSYWFQPAGHTGATLRAGLIGALVLGAAASVAAAFSLPPFTTFAKAGPAGTSGTAVLEHVRVGRHQGFDRIAFEFRNGTAAWSARYVPKVVHDGSGKPVPLSGRAFLHVVFHRASVDRPSAGGPDIVRTPSFPTLLQLKEAGDFEGVVSFGLGLRRRVGFRGFRLAGPSRIVIDVAH